ncbi:hypothetical protein [Hoeflea sp.]
MKAGSQFLDQAVPQIGPTIRNGIREFSRQNENDSGRMSPASGA